MLLDVPDERRLRRRQAEQRNVLVPPGADGPTGYLIEIGTVNGANALGLGEPVGTVEVDLSHPHLADIAEKHALAALLFGGTAAALRTRPNGGT